ncbi:hydantoinase/oxoprolinase family protein [Paraburkholderia denitrificans]|uniref:Hydantoinase/oxoprolinase family protein n=1 Tax=Paraburkholderia denitrificans TaxID=694025 RepID=A0ABW0JDP7_9BURK
MKRIAVDIGGTFTDCFVCWGGRFIQSKALTTHQNLALGFNEALDEACAELNVDRRTVLSEVDSVRYATTLGTNALIERSGPRVGLLITQGFDSTVPLSRGRGYADGLPYSEARDLTRARRPEPLVSIPLIRHVRERVDYKGDVVMPLDEEATRRAIRELVDAGAQAIVVALVNSTDNPAHELRVLELFLQEYPAQMLGAVPMILSHQVVGRKGEYVRATSAIIDAMLHSTMYFAMTSLEQNLRDNGYSKPMLLVHNSGGMAQLNSTDALQTVHSGPVAGIHAAETLGQQGSVGNIICGDMGGTSFDIGIVAEGGHKHYDFNPVVDRWLVSVPMVHLVTLGAGGGSIARYDTVFQALQVGPQSAGSDPGPACYDRGGLKPTVTDADLLLGYLDPANYANGRIKLNVRRTKQALEEICDTLDCDAIEAARRIKLLADASMAAGLVRELNQRGYKPDNFVFLAYGGNGPLHACGIAAQGGFDRVLAPPYSSVFSASGGAGLNQMHIHEKNTTLAFYHKLLQTVFSDFPTFNAIVEELEDRGRRDLLRQGVRAEDVEHRLELDMRYGMQRMEIALVAPKLRIESQTDVLDMIQIMNDEFARRFGADTVSPESGIWVTAVRVVSFVRSDALRFDNMLPPARKLATPAPVTTRQCHFPGHDGAMETPVYDGAALEPGVVIEGPAIVNPGATTYLVEPGWRFESAAQGAVWFIKNA